MKLVRNKFKWIFPILLFVFFSDNGYPQDTIRICDTLNKIDMDIPFVDTNSTFYRYFDKAFKEFPLNKTITIYSNGKKYFSLFKLNDEAYTLIRFSLEGYPWVIFSKSNKHRYTYSILLDGTKELKVLHYEEPYKNYYKSYYFPNNIGLIKVRYYSNRGRNVNRYIRKMPKEFYDLLDYILCR